MAMQHILLTLLLSVSPANASGGGFVVDNGGGLAEHAFTLVYQTLHEYLDICMHPANDCQLTNKEARVLRQIWSESEAMRDFSGLVFKSGRLNPGMFETDEHGKTRVAVTGLRPGTPIYVNLDVIYSADSPPKPLIDVQMALSILIHEMGHHTGETDHQFLDQLGNKVRVWRDGFVQQIDFRSYRHKELKVMAHNHALNIHDQRGWLAFPRTNLTLENGHQIVDLAKEFEKEVQCSNAAHWRRSIHYANLTWHSLKPFDSVRGRQAVTFSLDVDLECHESGPGDLGGAQIIESNRVKWTGYFQFKVASASGELVDAGYPENWRIYDEYIFSVSEQEIVRIPN